MDPSKKAERLSLRSPRVERPDAGKRPHKSPEEPPTTTTEERGQQRASSSASCSSSGSASASASNSSVGGMQSADGDGLGQLGEELWGHECDFIMGGQETNCKDNVEEMAMMCGDDDEAIWEDNKSLVGPESPTPRNTDRSRSNTYDLEQEPRIDIKRALDGVRMQLSTDSSVHATSTVTNPNADQLLFCMAIVIQAQVYNDHAASAARPDSYPEFSENIMVEELAAPEPVSELESDERRAADTEDNQKDKKLDVNLLSKIMSGQVPTLDSVYSFLVEVYNRKNYTDECNIIALIYLNRILSKGNLPLSSLNWRSLWVVTLILAQKMWSDKPLKTSEFVTLLPGMTKRQLSQLEIRAMELLNYATGITPSLYAKYYFELRHLMKEALSEQDCSLGNGDGFKAKPLTLIQAKQLVQRSSRPVMRNGGSSSTLSSSSSSSSSLAIRGDASGSVCSSTNAFTYQSPGGNRKPTGSFSSSRTGSTGRSSEMCISSSPTTMRDPRRSPSVSVPATTQVRKPASLNCFGMLAQASSCVQKMQSFSDVAGGGGGFISSGSGVTFLSRSRAGSTVSYSIPGSRDDGMSSISSTSSSKLNKASNQHHSPRIFARTDDEPRELGERTRFVIRELEHIRIGI